MIKTSQQTRNKRELIIYWLDPPEQCWIEVRVTDILALFPSVWGKQFSLFYEDIWRYMKIAVGFSYMPFNETERSQRHPGWIGKNTVSFIHRQHIPVFRCLYRLNRKKYCFLSIDIILLYLDVFKESTYAHIKNPLLELVNELNKVTGYKINI